MNKDDCKPTFSSSAAAWRGLAAAWDAAKHGCEVTLLTRASNPEDSNTYRAQGGIIYRGRDESPEQLVADILSAGAGLSSPEAASLLSREGPRLVKEILIDELHVPFDPSPEHPGELDLTNEAGHSIPRIIHFKDRTGYSIERAFFERVKSHPKDKSDRERDRRGPADGFASLDRTHRCLSPADLRRSVCARPDHGKNIFHPGQGNHSRFGRARQRFSAHHESSGRARRRNRHGLSRRSALHQYAVHPVPSHRAAGSGRLFPDFGNGSRRRRPRRGPPRKRIHAAVSSRRIARPARYRRARHLSNHARIGRAVRLSRHHAQARRPAPRAFSRASTPSAWSAEST